MAESLTTWQREVAAKAAAAHPLTPATTPKVGDRYNWKNQPERLVYIGRSRAAGQSRWHQFEKVDEPGVVWCEVLDTDLHMLEKTAVDALQFAFDQVHLLRIEAIRTSTGDDRTAGRIAAYSEVLEVLRAARGRQSA